MKKVFYNNTFSMTKKEKVEVMKRKLDKLQKEGLKNHEHFFWKDGNPPECLTCRKVRKYSVEII